MLDKLLVNDVHLGVIRSSGTTLQTAQEIRDYLQESLRALLMEHLDMDVIVNGDLFDQFSVPMSDVLGFYGTAQEWLLHSADTAKLVLGKGNHDDSKDNSKMSAFAFIGAILKAQYPDRVVVVDTPKMIFPGIYMIPHMPNQEQFDLELTKVPDETSIVLVHANYDNHFAVESDHSLNMSEEQAIKLIGPTGEFPERYVVFGHEHQARTALSGYLKVTGNQWPSSVADCQHNPDNKKFAHIIGKDFSLTPILTWDGEDNGYGEPAWDEIDSCDIDTPFVRVSGNATSEQAPDVIKAIAGFRKRSSALVITNGVRIAGVSDMAELQVSMEEVKSFDVLKYLLENLDADQGAVVTRLLNNEEEKQQEAA